MLTILANIKIDNLDRLQHFKDSLDSFSTISDNWLINIRGLYRNQAFEYIRGKLKERLVEFNLLDDERWWSRNVLDMIPKAKYEYILLWNEDHINLAPQEIYKELVNELSENRADYMVYSWWFFGRQGKCFRGFEKKKLKHVDIVDLTADLWEKIKEKRNGDFVISLISIFHKNLLNRLLIEDIKKWPNYCSRLVYKLMHIPSILGFKIDEMDYYHFFKKINNKFFKDRFSYYKSDGPFNIEKEDFRTDYLPLTLAIPKQELFACIDKDNNNEASSLIKRGLYSPLVIPAVSSVKENFEIILGEINDVLSKINEEHMSHLTTEILKSKNIIVAGAGRMGMAARGFAMRLSHLGFHAFTIGDSNVPAVGEGDLFLACSGSGETQTVFDLMEIVQKNKAQIGLITGNLNSRMGKLADFIVELKAPSKVKVVDGFVSKQPMTTLNEQCVSLLFDAIVLQLMDILNEQQEKMWLRHSNLE